MTPHPTHQTLPPALKARVLAAVRQQPAPVRSNRLLAGLGLTGLALAALATAFTLAGGPAHAAGRPATAGEGLVVGTLLLALAATRLSLPGRRSMLAPARGQLLAVILGVPALVAAWLLLWHTTYADPFVRQGWICFALTATTGPWCFAVLAWASPRLDPRHPALVGAALGATAGAWSAVMVELWCPLSVPAHVAVGHVFPIVLLALAGALYGARRFRLRPRRP